MQPGGARPFLLPKPVEGTMPTKEQPPQQPLTEPANVNVTDLFSKLVAAGIITKSEEVEIEKEKEKPKEPEESKEVGILLIVL